MTCHLGSYSDLLTIFLCGYDAQMAILGFDLEKAAEWQLGFDGLVSPGPHQYRKSERHLLELSVRRS